MTEPQVRIFWAFNNWNICGVPRLWGFASKQWGFNLKQLLEGMALQRWAPEQDTNQPADIFCTTAWWGTYDDGHRGRSVRVDGEEGTCFWTLGLQLPTETLHLLAFKVWMLDLHSEVAQRFTQVGKSWSKVKWRQKLLPVYLQTNGCCDWLIKLLSAGTAHAVS